MCAAPSGSPSPATATAAAASRALERAATALRLTGLRRPLGGAPDLEQHAGHAPPRWASSASRASSPARPTDEAGGDATAALRSLARAVGRPRTYAAVIGSSFRAGSSGAGLPAHSVVGDAA